MCHPPADMLPFLHCLHVCMYIYKKKNHYILTLLAVVCVHFVLTKFRPLPARHRQLGLRSDMSVPSDYTLSLHTIQCRLSVALTQFSVTTSLWAEKRLRQVDVVTLVKEMLVCSSTWWLEGGLSVSSNPSSLLRSQRSMFGSCGLNYNFMPWANCLVILEVISYFLYSFINTTVHP